MSDKATVTLYKIRACGLFKYPQSRKPEFGDVATVLRDLNKWGKGLHLEETKTYDPDENSDLFPIYLADIAEVEGDWVVAMWNAVPESEGGVAAISANSQVGNPSVEISPSKKGTIPGFATYFWVLPDENLLVTVRLHRPFTGQSAMQLYIDNFIRFYSGYVVHDPKTRNTDDITPLGYANAPKDTPQQLHAKFRTRLCRLPSEIDTLAGNASNIYKISRKESLDLVASVPRSRWETMTTMMGLSSPSLPNRKKAKLEYTTDITINAEEVKSIAAEWEKDGGPESGIDIGFKQHGDNNFVWLSGSIARDEIDVQLTNKTPEFFDAAVLLHSLRRHRSRLVRMVVP